VEGSRRLAVLLGLGFLALVVAVVVLAGPDRVAEFFDRLRDVRGLVAWGGYTVLAVIVFAETGLLVGFFLPGDSLLVTAGVFAAPPFELLDLALLQLLLVPCAIVGDAVNYSMGVRIGPAIFRREDGRLFKKAHVLRAQRFYERHGGKTIILARFLPILRTFAPFAAGMASMPYRRFVLFNVVGAVAWVVSMTLVGYLLARAIPDVERHVHIVAVIVVVLSFIPAMVEVWRARRRARLAPPSSDPQP
jgi:membrane-associated protein